MSDGCLDILLINPGDRGGVYQDLGETLVAVEPPLWCRLIGGYVRDRGYSVQILDADALAMDSAAVANRVRDLAPTLVVMVVFGHQPSASTQMMTGAGEACRLIKDLVPQIPLLIVGGHVSALPEQTLADEAVDYVCKGEGPLTVAALLAALKAQDPIDLSTIPGLGWRDQDGNPVINSQAALITDLDRDLHGNVWDLLPMGKYTAHNWQCLDRPDDRTPYASIYTSLGCPYKCSFCCINAPFDSNRYRMRSPENVVAEIDHLYQTYGIKTFKIIDEMFVLNERHVVAICDGLIGKSYASELNFWAYSRVDTVKPQLLQKLRQAGIRWLALGIESGSKHVRDGSDKRLRSEDIIAVVREIQKADISVIGNYIFGLPDDTLETMRETLDLAKELNCEFANFYSAMAYPGSALYNMAVAQGWALPKSWSGYSQHAYETQPLPTETLASHQVLAFRDLAFHEYFQNTAYLDMVTQRFGWAARGHIQDMSKYRLRRKIIEEAAP